ncbi:MAG: hypothetical protein NTX59_11065 [Elusimicrobia bacterium]|nr:hypothetical protein [Elusimicrobiota bacterium]
MKIAVFMLFCLIIVSQLAPVRAQALPDLKAQAAWGEKEKQEFLKFLKSDQQVPITGQVKKVAAAKGERAAPRKARYFTLNMVTDTLLATAADGKVETITQNSGPQVLLGGHLFSWVRYYGGLKYNRLSRQKLDGTEARLTHFEIPVGMELALIPLGTPQTRYVIMRLGLSAHSISGPADKSDFKTPLLGWYTAWNAGVGYEWQFANSNWRAHLLAEGYRSFAGSNSPKFYGIGLTGGFVYTF